MLYVTFPGLIYLITGSLYLLTSFFHFTHPLLPASGRHQSILCIYEPRLQRAVLTVGLTSVGPWQVPGTELQVSQASFFNPQESSEL